MVLGKPRFVKTQPLGELNLLQQFFKGLAFRHPGSCLIVTESPKPHAMFLLLALVLFGNTRFSILISGPVYSSATTNSDLAKIAQCHCVLQSSQVLSISHWFST